MDQRKMLWRPSAPEGTHNPFDKQTPKTSDWYLTVDEIEEDRVRLVVAHWPWVDSTGRLRFPTPESDDGDLLDDPSEWEWLLDARAFHSWVTDHRARSSQGAPDRPLRIGDTFWFRGKFTRAGEPMADPSGKILDVTYAARGEAKAAMAWAVTGSTMVSPDLIVAGAALEEDEAEEEAMEEIEIVTPRPSVPGSVARPSI